MKTITKVCSNCNQEKSLSEFSNSKSTKDGKMYVCKKCNREINHEWRKTPSGIYTLIKSRQRHYEKTYNNRCKPFNLKRKTFITWYNETPKTCHYCGLPEEHLKNIHGGHLDRVNRLTVDCIDNEVGYEINNIVLACNRCNLIKSNVFSYDEMREIGEKYLKPKWELEVTKNQSVKEEKQ